MEQNASHMSTLLKKLAEGNGEEMQDFDFIARSFVYGGSSTRKMLLDRTKCTTIQYVLRNTMIL